MQSLPGTFDHVALASLPRPAISPYPFATPGGRIPPVSFASSACRAESLVSSKIFTHTFDNGLVLLAEPTESLESAAFTLRVPGGNAYEPLDRAGLATLAQELAIRGCGTRDNRQFVEDLDNLGVDRGESVFDSHASYSGATLARNLTPALEIFADLVQRPTLPEDELEACKMTVLQEISAVEDEPSQKVMLELRRQHFPDPWGRPSHGSEQGVVATSIADIRQFVARTYQPRGAILGVAGRVDWDQLRRDVERLFGKWKAQPELTITEKPAGDRVTHIPHESNQTQIGIAYPSVAYRDKDYFQAWGAVGVLSGGMSSRLFTEVREKRGLCYSVFASQTTLRDRGSVICYAGTSAERAQETLDVTLGELKRLAEGVSPEELARLRARMKSALVMQQESSSARSGSLVRDFYYLGAPRSMEETNRLVDGLSAESINAYLSANPPRNFTIVTLGSQPLKVDADAIS
jgi:predicted Zn-dependent peptidase